MTCKARRTRKGAVTGPDLVVRAGSPAALLTLVPHLPGLVPEASLVVIGVAPPRDRIRVTLRYDLPEPPEPGLVAGIVAHAVGLLRTQRLTAAVAVGYGPETLVTPAADGLRDAARRPGSACASSSGSRTAATGPARAATRRAALPPACRPDRTRRPPGPPP